MNWSKRKKEIYWTKNKERKKSRENSKSWPKKKEKTQIYDDNIRNTHPLEGERCGEWWWGFVTVAGAWRRWQYFWVLHQLIWIWNLCVGKIEKWHNVHAVAAFLFPLFFPFFYICISYILFFLHIFYFLFLVIFYWLFISAICWDNQIWC